MPLLTTGPIVAVPESCVIVTTASPPVTPPVRGLPLASLAVTVMIWLLVPSAVTVVVVVVIVDCAASTGPASPVALKVTGEPVRLALVAVRVLGPAWVPSVQPPTVAMPAALVVAVGPLTEPPPEATAKVTLTPLTG